MKSIYITKSTNYFFLVTILQKESGKSSKEAYFLYISPVPSIGDYDIPTIDTMNCLNIEIKIRKNTKSAHIHRLNHDNKCALRSPDDIGLEKGKGTFEMVMSTLYLCNELFGVKSFTLEDASKFYCEPANTNVQLNYHNLLVYGNTYYERRFKAVPKDEWDIPEWLQVKEKLKDTVPADYSILINDGVLDRIDEEYIEQFMMVVLKHQGKSSWNQLFYSIDQLEDSCVYFTNEVLAMLLHFAEIRLPTFTNFLIKISSSNSRRYLINHEQIF